MILVKLEHAKDGAYIVRSWDDSSILATGCVPLNRPPALDLVQYADRGIGEFEPDGQFKLLLALGELPDAAPLA